ncbi:hypothetical protein HPB50_011911 [Hyalomma asiaticum]|uniref:Uncharacterized protein n=1 Tax=Hyalomma asiaticum TaxID=266040 RepID=A0ACB7TJ52_HYAAI|nr:hypothetical protein HPB50_011911 [Hyalomma asiaticum]
MAEVSTAARLIVCVVGTAATAMALSVQSVYTLWSLSSDVVYVMLLPQLFCLFYLDRMTNTYGIICGVLVGMTTRLLCGEPSMNLPVALKLPFYDEGIGQRFPHRTLCMSLNMTTTVIGSVLWEKLFRLGYVPKHLDCCRCFEEVIVREEPDDAVKQEIKPTDSARPDSVKAETKTANVNKAADISQGYPYLSSAKRTDTGPNDIWTPTSPADFSYMGASPVEGGKRRNDNFSRASSHVPSGTASVISTRGLPAINDPELTTLRLFGPSEASI